MLDACDLSSFNSVPWIKGKSAFVLLLFRGIQGFKEQTGRLNQMVFWRQSRRMKQDDVTQRSRMETCALEDARRWKDVTKTWLCLCAIHFLVSHKRQTPLMFNIWSTCWSLSVFVMGMVEFLLDHYTFCLERLQRLELWKCFFLTQTSIHPSIRMQWCLGHVSGWWWGCIWVATCRCWWVLKVFRVFFYLLFKKKKIYLIFW